MRMLSDSEKQSLLNSFWSEEIDNEFYQHSEDENQEMLYKFLWLIAEEFNLIEEEWEQDKWYKWCPEIFGSIFQYLLQHEEYEKYTRLQSLAYTAGYVEKMLRSDIGTYCQQLMTYEKHSVMLKNLLRDLQTLTQQDDVKRKIDLLTSKYSVCEQ